MSRIVLFYPDKTAENPQAGPAFRLRVPSRRTKVDYELALDEEAGVEISDHRVRDECRKGFAALPEAERGPAEAALDQYEHMIEAVSASTLKGAVPPELSKEFTLAWDTYLPVQRAVEARWPPLHELITKRRRRNRLATIVLVEHFLMGWTGREGVEDVTLEHGTRVSSEHVDALSEEHFMVLVAKINALGWLNEGERRD